MSEARLQKILAHAGVASRREAERMIADGRVKINGTVAKEPGTKADPDRDSIELDGRPVSAVENKVYYILNKPAGCVTTMRDPQGRRTVRDLLSGIRERVYPVGRLDYDTTGVLIVTNDGELANGLAHPRREIEKCYHTKVEGVPSGDALKKLSDGIMLDDGITAPARVRLLEAKHGKARLEIIIHEGRNRQVKRMCEAIGHRVIRLARTRFGPIGVEGLKPGEFREMTPPEIESLKGLTADNVAKKG